VALFSGTPLLVRRSLAALLSCPHNNLRLFVAGRLVETPFEVEEGMLAPKSPSTVPSKPQQDANGENRKALLQLEKALNRAQWPVNRFTRVDEKRNSPCASWPVVFWCLCSLSDQCFGKRAVYNRAETPLIHCPFWLFQSLFASQGPLGGYRARSRSPRSQRHPPKPPSPTTPRLLRHLPCQRPLCRYLRCYTHTTE